ncbi:hypothetical protein KKD40_06615 [Candidatus Micrarchaeota archaeon]|nr:hypothetical protein [Candidatus Micrarchaeota archaeon]
MKKMEYLDSHNFVEVGRQEILDASKHDEYELPEFSKEVPVSSKVSAKNGKTIIEYNWKRSKTPIIRIEKIDYRSAEDLEGVYRIAARDGTDSASFVHNNTTYIIRKTVKEIAMALYNAYGKIKGAFESIVGYIRTVLGNEYVISKVDGETWAFDRRISRGGIKYLDAESLGRKSKRKLCDMIVEKISEIHENSLIMGRFTLNNILVGEKDVKFTDLRRLRLSRRKSFVTDEFIGVLQYLFGVGIASADEIYFSIAHYAAQNEESCNDWYETKTGKKNPDSMELVHTIEEEVYN